MRLPARRVSIPILLAFLLLTLAVFAGGFFAYAGLASSPWPKFHRDSANAGRAANVAAATAQVKWGRITGGVVESSPVIGSDGTIYVGSHDGYLWALEPSDGTVKWKFNVGSRITSAPAINDSGIIYVATWDGRVVALDTTVVGGPSEPEWEYYRGTGGFDESFASPAIAAAGNIYISGEDAKLYALDSAGVKQWDYALDTWSDSCPAVAGDGTIYIGAGRKLYALDSGGTIQVGWPVTLSGTVISSSPAIAADGTVYVGTVDVDTATGYLHAISDAGAILWAFRADGPIYSSPAIGPSGRIYFGADDHKLYCLDTTGAKQWTFETGSWIDSSPAVSSDEVIYFGSRDGWVYAIDQTGGELWAYRIGHEVSFSSPAIGSDGTVYVGASDQTLYAFNTPGAVRVSADDAEGVAGQQNVPVNVVVNVPVTIKRFSFTLAYNTGVVGQPQASDVSTTLPGFALTVTPASGLINVVGQAATAASVPAGGTLATVAFDVLPVPGVNEFSLPITSPSLTGADDLLIANVLPGTAGTFDVVTLGIYPDSPHTVTRGYLCFHAEGATGLAEWSLTSKGSGADAVINPSTGIYRAGSQPGIDEVQLTVGGQSVGTDVSVVSTSPPPGTPASPTSLDLDGGGVSSSDVALILRGLVGLQQLTAAQQAAADFNGDGIGLSDAVVALRIAAGLPPVP